MIYHTNHCWCSNSNWENRHFSGEVMVVINKYISTDSISPYENKLINPDFERLTLQKQFYNTKKINEEIETMVPIMENNNSNQDDINFFKKMTIDRYSKDKTIVLKEEVINWLNINIKDHLALEVDNFYYLNDIKAWATGNDYYNAEKRGDEITIFFDRQVDALKFIRKFSIFKEPTFYFDYFNDKRIEKDINTIINTINEFYKLNQIDLTLNQSDLNIKEVETSIDMDYENFELLDWEKDEDDIHLDKNEMKNAIKDILNV